MIVNNYNSWKLFSNASVFKYKTNFRLSVLQKQAILGVLSVIAMIAVCIFIELSKRKEISQLKAEVNKWNKEAVDAKAKVCEIEVENAQLVDEFLKMKIKNEIKLDGKKLELNEKKLELSEKELELSEQLLKYSECQLELAKLACDPNPKVSKKAQKVLNKLTSKALLPQ